MAERILPTEAQDPASASASTLHAYNVPDLSPIEFLTAVYRDTHLPMVSRIQAASALLPYTHPAPRPVVQGYVAYPCKIIIGGLGPGGPDDPTRNHSQNPNSPEITLTRDDDTVAPLNLTRSPDPPSPTDLLEIKAAINKLRPDLAHLPIPEPRLCACGHWLFGPCPLGDHCREKSKLN